MAKWKVIFKYDDGTEDYFIVSNLGEALEYETDPDFAGVEILDTGVGLFVDND